MIGSSPIRTVPPVAMPVTVAEFKAQARVDLSDEDALIAGYLRAAAEHVEQYTGLSLITSPWTQTFSAWPTTKDPDMVLWRRPLRSVSSVQYLDSSGSPAGASVILDPSGYRVVGADQDMVPARLRLATNATWPVLYADPEAITVTYIAGFGGDHNSVPELIRHAILLIASTWYGFREDIIMGSTVSEIPWASRALLRNWRPLAVA